MPSPFSVKADVRNLNSTTESGLLKRRQILFSPIRTVHAQEKHPNFAKACRRRANKSRSDILEEFPIAVFSDSDSINCINVSRGIGGLGVQRLKIHNQHLLLGDMATLNELSGGKPFLQMISSANQAASRQLSPVERMKNLIEKNAVVVFSVSSCCMCHVAKRLFCTLGVSPIVIELDEEKGGTEMEKALRNMMGAERSGMGAERSGVPAVFVGGKLVGGLDTLMASHISGSLIPQLKEAGALWL